ncbi:GNAT family N-acetyltransferase [Nibribacter ruber]|uniref:GNAT family N-acetyltransferase n=1 Tax=Nibribacter ruber TaxID=2698458 RepID=A0A6P1NYQ0_9BACT|nr:GNAT family N-acetyltransferase [Nibribacter ruber]QHL87349.1 GNAT family N-acetyltransferase [Nibribacter ruber]
MHLLNPNVPPIDTISPSDYQELTAVWEASVRATHHFLEEKDIQFFKPLILNEFLAQLEVRCVRENSKILGFVGIADGKVEMLFLHPDARGKGIGKQLLRYAISELNATEVDVNEQNDKAVGFYLHNGFVVESRSELDGMGKPFPLLHMGLKK